MKRGHGALLRRTIERSGRTYAAVAADVEISGPHLSLIQNGLARPSIDVVHRLAAALDIRPWTKLLDDLSLGMPEHLQPPNGKQARSPR